MSVQSFAPRSAWGNVGAAGLGALVTLLIFVVVFVTFILAPLVALALALVGYAVWRPAAHRPESSGPTSATAPVAYGFGAGVR
jgi:hypothetical protein